jgi:peptidoglycan/LPS O-acetylase OafA/YrhL
MTGAEAHSEYLRARRFPALDGLRAVAIAAVVAYHAAGKREMPLLDRGLGVTLFFTLSGFLITALLLRERRRAGAIHLPQFYLRRSLRILPLYYLVLGLYVVLVRWMERGTPEGARFFHSLPTYLSFTSNWISTNTGPHAIFAFAWSLATQEQFYLLWPLLVRFSRARALPPVVMGLLLCAGEGARWAVASGDLPSSALAVRMLASVPVPICLGSIAAYALDREWGFRLAHRIAGRPWSAPIWAGALVLALLLGRSSFALAAAAVLLVVSCVVKPDNLLRPLLENRAILYLGSVSYGIYLMHMLALNAVRRVLGTAGTVPVFVAALALTTLLAGLSYSLLERPIMEWGKGLLPLLGPRTLRPGEHVPATPR